MDHSIRHGMDQGLARRVAHKALESYQARFAEYKPTGEWLTEDRSDISFTVAGKTLHGSVEVKPTTIDLSLDVPLLFRPFRSIAIKVIEDEIEGWLKIAREGKLPE